MLKYIHQLKPGRLRQLGQSIERMGEMNVQPSRFGPLEQKYSDFMRDERRLVARFSSFAKVISAVSVVVAVVVTVLTAINR